MIIDVDRLETWKPDRRIYTEALDISSVAEGEALMVAAHCFDLNAAHAVGMKTALVTRPSEPGSSPEGLDHEATYIVRDLADLSTILDAGGDR